MSNTPAMTLLRAPPAAYVLGGALGVFGAFLPYLAPALVSPWEGAPSSLAVGSLVGLALHALLHALARPRGERGATAFVAGAVLPEAAALAAAALVFALAPGLRAASYAAFVVNAAASTADVWEACLVARLRPLAVRRGERGLECRVA